MKKILALLVVATMLATAAFCAFSVSAAGTNIALNKEVIEQKISTHPSVGFYNADLTDGKTATVISYGNPDKEWYSFYYSAAATEEGMVNVEHSTKPGADGKDVDVNVGTVIIDLASVSTVESIKIHFEKEYLPEVAELQLSSDGKSYTTFAKQDITTESGEIEGAGEWVEFKANAAEGRYVKLICTFSGMFCMLDEIEVYGTENTGAGNNEEDKENSKEESKEESKDDAPSSSSTPTEPESTSSDNGKPTTGDAGMLTFAVLAVLAVAGSVVAIRVRH